VSIRPLTDIAGRILSARGEFCRGDWFDCDDAWRRSDERLNRRQPWFAAVCVLREPSIRIWLRASLWSSGPASSQSRWACNLQSCVPVGRSRSQSNTQAILRWRQIDCMVDPMDEEQRTASTSLSDILCFEPVVSYIVVRLPNDRLPNNTSIARSRWMISSVVYLCFGIVQVSSVPSEGTSPWTRNFRSAELT
jgi:hypothetical protein